MGLPYLVDPVVQVDHLDLSIPVLHFAPVLRWFLVDLEVQGIRGSLGVRMSLVVLADRPGLALRSVRVHRVCQLDLGMLAIAV